MSVRRLQKTLNEFLEQDRAFVDHIKDPDSKKVVALYGLKEHRYRIHEKLGSLQRALENLQEILLRNPTTEEIALELGTTRQDAERLAYSTAKHTGWFPPSGEEIDRSWRELGELLFLAARLHRAPRKWSRRFAHEPKMLKRARFHLSNHPEMLPRLNRDASMVIAWPEAAMRYLHRPYSPKRAVAKTRSFH